MQSSATLDELLIKPVVFTPPIRLVDPGSWVNHIPFAFWLMDALQPRAFVELGTQSGNSYAAFAQAVQTLRLQTACYAVDTWKGDAQAGFYGEEVWAEWSAFHERHFSGFSRLMRSTFDEALAHFAERSIDLLHIDGCHVYEAVRHDFETWLPKLSERAIVVLHDINVREADFGAWKLWHELEARYPCFAFLHGNGLGVVGVGREPAPLLAWMVRDLTRDVEQAALVRRFFSTLGDGLYGQWRLDARERREREVRQEFQAALADSTGQAQKVRQELESALADSIHQAQAAREAQAEALARATQDDARATDLASQLAEQVVIAQQLRAEADRLGEAIAAHRGREAAEIDRLREELRAAGRALAIEWRPKQGLQGAQASAAVLRSLRRELDESDKALAASTEETDRLTGTLAQIAAELDAKDATVRLLGRTLTEIRHSRIWRLLGVARAGPGWLRPAGLTLPAAIRRPARFARSLKPMLSPRRLRNLRLVAASGLFDEAFYLRHNPDISGDRVAPLVHYVVRGGAEGRSPGPLFDARFYLTMYPDVARSGLNPLVHYLLRGHLEARDPHALFATRYYLEKNPDVAALEDNALVHFLRSGGLEARSPHPLFDAAFYLDANPDVRAAGVNPLQHFLEQGGGEGRAPHALFDASYYLATNRDVRHAGVNPLLHYLEVALRDNRDPHPLFDNDFYLEHATDLRELGVNPLMHFVLHGSDEGRRPNRLFDPAWYLRNNPDVARGGINPLAHYARWGWREGRDPSPEFSTSFYLAQHQDVAAAGLNPLGHFLSVGEREGRVARPARLSQVASRPPVPARVTMKVSGSAARDVARPTIVCVTHAVPCPPRAGNEVRVHRMLKRLRSIGYRIVLVAAPLPGDTIDAARFEALVAAFGNVVYCERDGTVRYRLDECRDVLTQLDQRLTGVYAIRLGETRPLLGRALESLSIDRAYCHETVVAVMSELQAYLKPSAVITEYVWMSRFLPLVGPDVLTIIDTLDVFFSKKEKVTVYGIEDFDIPVEEEVKRLVRADVVVAIQQMEAHMLEEVLPGCEVLVAGVDVEVGSTSSWPDSPVAFLVGSDNPMNMIGLRDFLRFAWPEIRRRVPEAVLEVAGRVGRAVPDHTKGVRVLGDVEHLGPCYARARVVINPAAAGTGLKIKTVEALGHLRPIVTWPNGLEGVPETLANLVPPVEDWLDFADRVCAHLAAREPLFDETKMAAIRHELSPEVVYGSLEARLARFFAAAQDRKPT